MQNRSLNAKEIKNYHPSTNLAKMFTNSAVADVNFIFRDENQKIPANKCLLAIASPVFQRMFYGDLKESGDINIVDASPEAFIEFLQFFYLDKFELTIENIAEVLTLADKYDVTGLMNLCGIYLEYNLNNESVSWIYELAIMFNMSHLNQLCCDRICLETSAVLATRSFKTCTKLVLTKILDMDALSCDEFLLFTEAMAWAEVACQRSNIEATAANKKQELGACFDLIRFPTMTTEEFTRCIANEGLFDASEYLSILTYLTLKRQIGEFRYSKQPRNGLPAWVKDKSITVCDRRSLPNLHRPVEVTRDVTVFSVNERVLLGVLSLSTFRSVGAVETKTGTLSIRRRNVDEDKVTTITELLNQSVVLSSLSFTKLQLEKPVVVQPFVEYEVQTDWELDDGEALNFRTQCRSEVMVDGGYRFQFHKCDHVAYDNIAEGLVARMYFKKW